MTQAKLKAIIYCRVSDPKQETQGNGLATQETCCRQFADQNGLEVEMVFRDTLTGGGDGFLRPGLKAMLTFLDAQMDAGFIVIFDDMKRFARETRFH
jgi:DNA invertase Pin-like site-specific DNA recombinase